MQAHSIHLRSQPALLLDEGMKDVGTRSHGGCSSWLAGTQTPWKAVFTQKAPKGTWQFCCRSVSVLKPGGFIWFDSLPGQSIHLGTRSGCLSLPFKHVQELQQVLAWGHHLLAASNNLSYPKNPPFELPKVALKVFIPSPFHY